MAGCLLIHPLLLRVSLCLAGVGTGFTENPESRLLSDLDYCRGGCVLFLFFLAYGLMLVALSPGQPLTSRKSGRGSGRCIRESRLSGERREDDGE